MDIQWDRCNLAHLLVENGWRGISPSEVEEVLRSPAAETRRLTRGRRKFRGPTDAGRRLTVVVEVVGPGRLRPRTAWETPR